MGLGAVCRGEGCLFRPCVEGGRNGNAARGRGRVSFRREESTRNPGSFSGFSGSKFSDANLGQPAAFWSRVYVYFRLAGLTTSPIRMALVET